MFCVILLMLGDYVWFFSSGEGVGYLGVFVLMVVWFCGVCICMYEWIVLVVWWVGFVVVVFV